MIPDTATRVQKHTAPYINSRIQHETQDRVADFESNDRRAAITKRLNELDQEWDIERTLQTNFALFSLIGLVLGTQVNKRWLALALAVPASMILHSLQGWCPPLPVFRRFGFRTSREINEERFALKSLRGDFSKAGHASNAEGILRTVKS
jgi:hypothetical protein